jgi:NADH-quinone oxidoreductase subunit J
MTVQYILFFTLATVAIATALGMLFSRNAVYAALFLITNFATVAVFYLLLDASFIALAQVTVYAGAIMVLFLFVIMLLGAEQTGRTEGSRWMQPLALGLGVVLLAEAVFIIMSQRGTLQVVEQVTPAFGGPVAVGESLFRQYVLPFEVTSILLLVAMIGAIVLSRARAPQA